MIGSFVGTYWRSVVVATVLLSSSSGCELFWRAPTEPVSQEAYPDGIWLLADAGRDALVVMEGAEEKVVFSNIAFGNGGVGWKYRRGDGVTPVGLFRVTEMYPSRKFVYFIALDYPTPDYADEGLRQGVISSAHHRLILEAHEDPKAKPPQTTALGGQIGIHGLGKGDPWVHENANWTSGCIALKNDEIRTLAALVKIGTTVKVRE